METDHEAEARNRAEDARHDKLVKEAEVYWKRKAQEKDWDCIRPDLSVYRYSDKKVTEDPRRTEEYRKKVLEGLGFGPGAKRDSLTEKDMDAIREVLGRKAGAFWLEGEPRTVLRHLLHDTIPGAPSCYFFLIIRWFLNMLQYVMMGTLPLM